MRTNGGAFSDREKEAVYRAIYERRDVRSQFTSEDVPEGTLRRLLDAAHHAPSVGFSQPWNFIVVRDRGTRSRVKEAFLKERERSAKLLDEPKRSRYLSFKLEGIMDSAVNLCITYDPDRFGPFVIGKSSMPETGIYSVCCGIQNLWLAARAEGIGVGWVSILEVGVLKSILKIPARIVPVAYLCLGKVTHFEEKPDLERDGWLPRTPLEDVVYSEVWGSPAPSHRDEQEDQA